MNTNYKVTLHSAIEKPWTDLRPIKIGGAGREFLDEADIFILLEVNYRPTARIDFYYSLWDYHGFMSGHGFDHAMFVNGYIVVGAGERIFFVELLSEKVVSYDLDSYFGSMEKALGYIFVTSADSLYCFNENGSLKWSSHGLGIDGVIVNSITEQEIYGDGEWDPPGDWRAFVLDFETGAVLRADFCYE